MFELSILQKWLFHNYKQSKHIRNLSQYIKLWIEPYLYKYIKILIGNSKLKTKNITLFLNFQNEFDRIFFI